MLRQIGTVRLIATILLLGLALLLARYSWSLPLTGDAERALYDLRSSAIAPQVEQDQRITMVVFNDETLEALAKRSPLDRKMLADALLAIDALGARAIGVDILIDQRQAEDAYLSDALRRMRTPTFFAFASNATNPDYIQPWQEEFLRGFLGEVSGGAVHPASIMLQPDFEDGVTRRWPATPPNLPPLLGRAMAPSQPWPATYEGAIRFRLPANEEFPVFSKLPIQLFTTEMAPMLRDQIAGRYVLVGGDIQDLDEFETPLTRRDGKLTKGLEVHAHLLAQLLDGRRPSQLPGWYLWLAALAIIAAGGLTSMLEVRGWKLALILFAQAMFIAALPVVLERMNVDTLTLPAAGWDLAWVLAFAVTGAAARSVGSEQRRFAQSALGKYLPPDIAARIIREPELLALSGEKKEIFALFTDLEGFTKLSHAIAPEQLSALLNRYLDLMSDVVLAHGGTIDKFVGDAVVAFWGAPIERPDDADRAARAAVAMYRAGQEFAAQAPADLPPVGRTRVGLHRGEAVVGNFGGKDRIQYTALGDGMNTAARLESANKSLKTTALVSDEAKSQSSLRIFRPMGRVVLSGRARPVTVWEPVPDVPEDELAELEGLWLRFDGGDHAALAELEALGETRKEDAAFADFLYRIREAGPGGAYVLASK